jgi:hypothetical protein
MSKFEPPAWVTEHLRIYRESGGTEGHLWEASAAGVPGLVPPYCSPRQGGARARSRRRLCSIAQQEKLTS